MRRLLAEAPAPELPGSSRGALLELIGEAGALLTRVDCPVTDGPAVKRALARLATEVAAAHRPWLFGESSEESAALDAVLRRLR